MSDSDSDIARANHRKSRTFRAPADDDVNSDDMAVKDRPPKLKKPASKPAHSAGRKRAKDNVPSYHGTLDDLSSSSSSSASSPSEDETSAKTAATSEKSASSPSDSSGEEAQAARRPSTSHGTHSVPRSPSSSKGANSVPRASSTAKAAADVPKPKQRAKKDDYEADRAAVFPAPLPEVPSDYVKPYKTRHDETLKKETKARTLEQLRKEINRAYGESFLKWDHKVCKGVPPVAFTTPWYEHDFSLPFANKYKELVPIVMERQAEDKRKKASSGAADKTKETAPSQAARHDAQLQKKTKARTIEQLQAQIEQSYRSHYPSFREEYEGAPPVAFTTVWFEHEFAEPFIRRYRELEPIVMERQAEDECKKASSEAPPPPPPSPPPPPPQQDAQPQGEAMEEDTPAHHADAAPPSDARSVVERDDGELSGIEEPSEEAMDDTPAPSVVPSVKPTKTSAPAKSAALAPKPKPASTDATHSVAQEVPAKPPKTDAKRKTVASVKHRRDESPSRSRRSSTTSKRSHEPTNTSCPPPSKEARRDPKRRTRSVSPNMARHLDRVKNTSRHNLIPVMDGYVSKDLAILTRQSVQQQHDWVPFFGLKGQYELLGLINHFGVPASYLPVEHCIPPATTANVNPLAHLTYHQLRIDQAILPWDFILTSTLGALPTFWRQCNHATGKHLRKELKNASKYRDLKVSAVGPAGIDLRGGKINDDREYEQQRLNLARFARIARKTHLGLVVVVQYDNLPPHKSSIHMDVINTLIEAGLKRNQRIHLIVHRATSIELVHWLEWFPRTLISFDLYLLGGIRNILGQPNPDPEDEKFLQAYAMLDFLKYMPLENISLHSGTPYPIGNDDSPLKTPMDVVRAATEFQLLTETRSEVVHANNAKNLIWFYNLDRHLLNYSVSPREHRNVEIGPRLSTDDLFEKIRALYPGVPARRAARDEQESDEQRSRSRTRSPARGSRSRRDLSPDRRRSPSRTRSPARAEHSRRGRSPSRNSRRSHSTAREDHPRRGRSPTKRRSPSRQSDKEPRSSSKPAHSAGRRNIPGRRRRRSGESPSPEDRRALTPLRNLHLNPPRSRPQSPAFVITLDSSPEQSEPIVRQKTEATVELKQKPIRLCDLKFPAMESSTPFDTVESGSRLEGRISREGQLLPVVPGIRKMIKTLKDTFGDAPQPSVRKQLKDLRRQNNEGEYPAHSAGATRPSASAHLATTSGTRAKCPDLRLLRIPPVFETDMFPEDLNADQIYFQALDLFKGEPEDESDLRPVDLETLASDVIPPAQPEIFQVPDPTGAPHPFDPYTECNGIDCNGRAEHNIFHRRVNATKLVIGKRWSNKKGIDDRLKKVLGEVKRLQVRALIQVIYIKYIERLKGNHPTRTPNALRFMHAVLTARNLRHELPQLLQRYKPLITDRRTNDPWPSPKDFYHAVLFWSCYCVKAATYIFNHLSGPIVFNSDWLEGANVPPGLQQTFADILVDDRQDILNDARHQIYRQYGYAHIEAVLDGLPEFEWTRFGEVDDDTLSLGPQTVQHTVLFVDQYIYDNFGANLRDFVQVVILDVSSLAGILDQLRDYYIHAATRRVVFWIGPDYIINQDKGYAFIAASFGFQLTAYFGNVEQYVVLPAYIRSARYWWIHSVLATYLQRADILPYARVVLDPTTLRHWERDERTFRTTGQLGQWDESYLDEDGYYRSSDVIDAVKWNLVANHDLDLWNDGDESCCKTTTEPTTTKSLTLDYDLTSSASGGRSPTTSLTTQTPSTSAHGAHSAPGLDMDQVAALLSARIPEGATPQERAAAVAAAMAYIQEEALSRISDQALQDVQPRLDVINEQFSRTQRPPKKSDNKKDYRSDSRKDKDREPRK